MDCRRSNPSRARTRVYANSWLLLHEHAPSPSDASFGRQSYLHIKLMCFIRAYYFNSENGMVESIRPIFKTGVYKTLEYK